MTRPAEIQAPRFQTSPDGLSVPKSCPFCRGEAAVNTIQWSAEHLAEQGLPEGIRFGVNCMRCGVNNRGGNGAATPDEAIARWNKRAEPVVIVALLAETARLEAALAVARHAYDAALGYICECRCEHSGYPVQEMRWEEHVSAQLAWVAFSTAVPGGG